MLKRLIQSVREWRERRAARHNLREREKYGYEPIYGSRTGGLE